MAILMPRTHPGSGHSQVWTHFVRRNETHANASLLEDYIAATQELGINIPEDGANGEAYGGFFVNHAQNPETVTRCSARNAYYDTAESRTNLHLLTGNQVTRLITSSNDSVSVTAVEVSSSSPNSWNHVKLSFFLQFATSSNATRQTVSVGKEAILAAGTLHTPQILQLSGIGEASLLSQYGITPVVDLPVGYNLHDHLYVSVLFDGQYSLINFKLKYSP